MLRLTCAKAFVTHNNSNHIDFTHKDFTHEDIAHNGNVRRH